MWQDYVFAIGSVLFTIALIPTIRGESKPALSSSLMTGSILAVFTFTYSTLGLWFSVVTSSATVACWFILAYQVWSHHNVGKSM